MAGSTNVLREFLVKIGFKVDEQKFKNFQEAMRTTAKNAAEMGKTALAASTVMGTSLKLIAEQMEGLYFASQRTGASTQELKEFSFAAAQVGVSAEQAQGAIEGLAAARRTNPGLNGLLGSLGIDPKQTDNARVLLQLLTKLHNMPYFQAAQIAGMFGISEQSFNMLEAGLPQMQKYLALREKMFRDAGISPDAMAGRSHEFMTQLRTLEAGATSLITEHPVEQGSVISDHVYKLPASVTLSYAWGMNSPLNTAQSQAFLRQLYAALLQIQSTLPLSTFSVSTGKRIYKSMLLENLLVMTDQETENVLSIRATCREVLIVNAATTLILNSNALALPATTAPITNVGPVSLQPAPQFNANGLPG